VTTWSPVRLGSILFTLVEPHPGHEVAYNRWYERDHFYAGVMVGPHTLAGQRWVATRADKALRQPPDMAGSYLGLYWIEDGHHDEWNRWGVDTVNRLHADGRMFAERDHVHTGLYAVAWAHRRDPDGVPPELALDHRYRGLVAMLVEGDVGPWYRDEHLPAVVPGLPVDQVLAFTPLPLLPDAPTDVGRHETTAQRLLLLWFLDADPADAWATGFADHGAVLTAQGSGRLAWAAPFRPTVPGTDTYTDQLW
jgi:hypothetical protein